MNCKQPICTFTTFPCTVRTVFLGEREASKTLVLVSSKDCSLTASGTDTILGEVVKRSLFDVMMTVLKYVNMNEDKYFSKLEYIIFTIFGSN